MSEDQKPVDLDDISKSITSYQGVVSKWLAAANKSGKFSAVKPVETTSRISPLLTQTTGRPPRYLASFLCSS